MNSEKHDLFDKLELIMVKIEYAYSIIELFTEQIVVNNHEEIVLSALLQLTNDARISLMKIIHK
ncbi:MAG TPA: hypothetical protein ACHBY4_15085 [Arsenophonus apicola]|uniref:hypothetical protein n=1 Tax=Arsenophonus apicola TaxID=2879119 RepID=UPI00387A5ED7